METISKKNSTVKILNAVANAFNEYKNAFEFGKDCSVPFTAFLASLKKELNDFEYEFDHLVGSETALIGGETKNYIAKENDAIIIDISVYHGGVWCDVTRSFFVGGYTKAQKERFELIKQTIKAAEAKLKANAKAQDIYLAAEKAYNENGETLVHHAGHLIKDTPVAEPRFIVGEERALASGDIVAIESGVYTNGFGLRLENDYLITDFGFENLFEQLMPLDIDNYLLKI